MRFVTMFMDDRRPLARRHDDMLAGSLLAGVGR